MTGLVPLAAALVLRLVLLSSLGWVGVGVRVGPAWHCVSSLSGWLSQSDLLTLSRRSTVSRAGLGVPTSPAVGLGIDVGRHAVRLLGRAIGHSAHGSTSSRRSLAVAATATEAAAAATTTVAAAAAAATRAGVGGFVDTDSASVKPGDSVRSWSRQGSAGG